MFKKIEIYIAMRYLRSKKTEGFISVVSLFSLLGIAIGVAALIIVMAVMNGFRIELTNKIVAFDGDIAVYAMHGDILDYEKVVAGILKNPKINNAFPMIEKQVLVAGNAENTNIGAQVRALSYQDLLKKTLISSNIIYGDLSAINEDFSVLIGEELAINLRVGVGGYIKIIAPEANQTIIGFIPRFKSFKVVGIFKAGMSDYDSLAIIMNIQNAQRFFRMNDMINTIEIHSKNPQESNITKFEIIKILPDNLVANDWQSKNLVFFNTLKTERVVMFLILTLIIIVAAFNIISSLIMLVKDKTHDIAILRTMGMRKASIIKIFFLVGSLLGVIGTLVGVTLGVSFALHIEDIRHFLESITGTNLFNPLVYFLSELPSDVQFFDIIMIALMSLGLSFCATIYPAWKASSIDPAKGVKI